MKENNLTYILGEQRQGVNGAYVHKFNDNEFRKCNNLYSQEAMDQLRKENEELKNNQSKYKMNREQEYLNSLANKPKRDKERIKPLLQELEKYWLKNHDLRFGQLVYNLSRFHDLDQFNVEDNKLLEILQNLNRKGGVVVEVKHNGVD